MRKHSAAAESEADVEARELRALARRYAGVLQQFRLGRLGERLARGRPLAVRDSTCGFTGDRWRLELDDGSVLRLKLFWPRHVAVCRLWSLRWADGDGWRVVVTTAAGELLQLRAFHATLGSANA